jgi:hypothetical protein
VRGCVHKSICHERARKAAPFAEPPVLA